MKVDGINGNWPLNENNLESSKPLLSKQEIKELMKIFDEDMLSEKKEVEEMSEIINFLQKTFLEDKFIQNLIQQNQEKIIEFLKDAFFYASLDEDAPTWVKEGINNVDYSTWLETFPKLSKEDLSYLKYLIVWGYKNYLGEKAEEIRKMKERLLKEENEYNVLNEMQKYLSEEEKLISPLKDIQNAAEQAMEEIDLDDVVESLFNK